MTIDIAGPTLLALLLATARSAAWVAVAPPFSLGAVPPTAKGILALGLALPVVPQLSGQTPGWGTGELVGALLMQVLIGAALGFLTYLFFAAIAAAGDLIDLFGGFTLAQAYDPLSMSGASVFGRLHQMFATTLFFATGAHLVVINGFLQSYDALPLDGALDLSRMSTVLTTGIGQFFLAALQIAAPLIGVLFLADVGLGLLTRVSPSLNAFSLGFPIKILLTLTLVGLTFPMLPGAVDTVTHLTDSAVTAVVDR